MSKFIVIEGCGGAGKTTQIQKLQAKYPDALFIREPGGTVPGEEMRELLFRHAKELDPIAQLYLVHAARWQNVIENILPALEQGRMVVCDRFQLSTFAYQVFTHGRDDLMEHMLETQAQFLHAGLKPHYIFLDISPEESMVRIATGREDDTDTFDEMGMEFQRLIYQGYKQGLSELGLGYTVIDARNDIEQVATDVAEAVEVELNQEDDNE